tara:strand:- start:9 stop:542 length:534 start_codon:yes stop_codon:yes gene_type:complete
MSQIINITSEALQATIRRLLPSQQGFGEDLQASNVITPIIDLTPTAEGSSVPDYLQQALAFGSQTAFNVSNTTSTLANVAGFYRVFGGVSLKPVPGTGKTEFSLSDGLSTKIIWGIDVIGHDTSQTAVATYDFIVFLATGESLSATSDNGDCSLIGSTRQIADVNGVLVSPNGFNPQ